MSGPIYQIQPHPGGFKHRFHAMVKPAASLCNLDCVYCYYLHKMELLGQPKSPRMPEDTLEQHIRQYIEAQDASEVVFSWQGGEPTLMGLDFFHRIVALQAKYKKPGQAIYNDLQTNGTLLDGDWAKFLADHGFLVGISIDGPRELHDRFRVYKGGQPSFDKVMRGLRLLQEFNVPFSAMCVINRENSKHPLEVFRFLAEDVGARQIQFIPCVEPKTFASVAPQHWVTEDLPFVGSPESKPGTPDSVVTDWTVDAEEWGDFLCAVWDEWLAKWYGKIHIDHFETAVAQSLGYPGQRCVTAEFCGKALALEHNGDAYSCDHYVYPEFRIGNIHESHWGELAYSKIQQEFGFAKRKSLTRYCQKCPHLSLCWGECPKNRFLRTPEGQAGLSYLCPGLMRFFNHIERSLADIVTQLRPHHAMKQNQS